MIWARSVLFAVAALLWTSVMALLYLPLLLARRRVMQKAAAFWCRGLIGLVAMCCGLHWRVIGRENLPPGAAVIAAKHQSAWETLVFHLLLDDPVFILKRELLKVPLIGWYMRKSGSIPIDRAAGFRSIKAMLPEVERALANGSQVIVFPEGTRTPPGQRRPYHPGIAAIYARTEAPIVTVALNSGMFWGRRRFLKNPGVITLEALPPMPLALGRAAFMEELERRIETATDRLCEEAAQVPQRSPHPLAPLAPSSVETLRADLPLPLGQGRGKRRGARHRGRSRRDLTSGT
jgi:1-acyl-sn-glycerol-3-phosphate acyltransferase